MCGIVGITGVTPVNQALYDALTVLQHRGQDAAGITTESEKGLHRCKDKGRVRDVFHTKHMLKLEGNVGIGHVRYPTAGSYDSSEAQPFYVNSPYGIVLAHNGNLTNREEVAEHLTQTDRRHLNTGSDSEVLLNVLAHQLQQSLNGDLTPQEIFDAVDALHKRCRGGYASVALILNHGIVAFRDPYGIRPLVLGKKDTMDGIEWMVASESVALDALQFDLVRDVKPGETIYIDENRQLHAHDYADAKPCTPCIFEYVYFARPDSIIDGLSVYKARLRMGEVLADRILEQWPEHDIDVVIPVPSSSRSSAMQTAHRLGLKYREGFVKNRYIGRTFIMPGQQMREQSVRRKLNAIDLEFRGKNVLIVDDSIVRGTTSKQIIRMAREAGAKKVYFASAAPAIRHPNVYGIDMPAAKDLVAHGRTEDQVQWLIGADRLFYQQLEDLKECVRHPDSDVIEFDDSCFSGKYITGDVTPEYLKWLENSRKS